MTNKEVAETFDNIADLMQIKGDNIYKIKAYRKAADTIHYLDEDIVNIYKKKRLSEIPGIGKSLASQIEELIEKGSLEQYEKIKKLIPEALLDMLALPGVAHKTIKIIYDELKIDNLDDLLEASKKNEIRKLPGLGGKIEYNIIKGIKLLKEQGGKITLGIALPMAEEFLDYLLSINEVSKVSLTGSLRRGKELVSDIDILLALDTSTYLEDVDKENIIEKIIKYKDIKKIDQADSDNINGELRYGIKFEIIIVKPEEYEYYLFKTTGSKEHYGLLKDKINEQNIKEIQLKSEFDIYREFKLDYIEPELRENQGELKAASERKLPKLLNLKDLKGDLHTHSDWSDGTNKIIELLAEAKKFNFSYIAITDHSKSLSIGGGLKEEEFLAQGRVIDEINKKESNFQLLKGVEVDIKKDGTLDFEDNFLKEFDIVIASIHSSFNLDKESQTLRLINAIQNPHVHIIGHLTGRLLNRRQAYEIDIDRILEEALKNKKILEINSHPDRLDINDAIARQAKEMGIKISINSDAHHKKDFALLRYGLITARRAWLEEDDVVNSWPLEKLIKYLKE